MADTLTHNHSDLPLTSSFIHIAYMICSFIHILTHSYSLIHSHFLSYTFSYMRITPSDLIIYLHCQSVTSNSLTSCFAHIITHSHHYSLTQHVTDIQIFSHHHSLTPSSFTHTFIIHSHVHHSLTSSSFTHTIICKHPVSFTSLFTHIIIHIIIYIHPHNIYL